MRARNYIGIFFICLVVGAEANLIRGKAIKGLDNEDFPSRQVLTAKVNDYVDKTIKMLGPFLQENGLEPLKLPDIEEGFEVKPIIVTYSAWFKLTEGQFTGITNVSRSGDQIVSYIGKTLRVRVQLDFSDIKLSYNYLIKVMNLGPTGQILGSLNNFIAVADVLIDFNNDEIHLQQFSISNVGRLRVRLSGNILFDWLLNPFISVFMRIFDNVIMKFVELTIRNVAQVAIASINSNIKEVIQRIEALN
ncbi:hypothetical protein KGM_214465 [Danaus plexippus plexippus]|uniref:Uncharacterized protein n=1 Tax=Danaus plexippus plexippus TaxID=278856 RepID=A0A212EP06_DANPL|nr:uncharacterized protein LOC116766772 [Danaus plexippus plexippus]OWR43206.1 hypothetical protein KGM_214465 [Danaus plexippus plexippus]